MRQHPNTIKYKEVGERLSKIRKEKELTQAELAALVGYSEKFIGRVENGYKFGIQFLYDVCEKADIPMDYLMFGNKPGRAYNINSNHVINLHDSGGIFITKVRDFYTSLSEISRHPFERAVQGIMDFGTSQRNDNQTHET